MQGADSNTEKISALMDGELDAEEVARQIASLKQDADRRHTWDAYHVIGDAMRGEYSRGMPAAALSARFSARFSQQLALEPTVLAPRSRTLGASKTQTYALAAAASVAAVAVVGWMSVSLLKQDEPQATRARAPAAPVVTAKAPLPLPAPVAVVESVAAPEHMHEYMLAHQGISPSTAIQGVTPYIRTVSSAGSASGIR